MQIIFLIDRRRKKEMTGIVEVHWKFMEHNVHCNLANESVKISSHFIRFPKSSEMRMTMTITLGNKRKF